MWVLVGLILISLAIGGATRRWDALAIPVVLIPLYYVGLRLEWWGSGVGDGWQFAGALITLATTVATAITVATTRAVQRWLRTRRQIA